MSVVFLRCDEESSATVVQHEELRKPGKSGSLLQTEKTTKISAEIALYKKAKTEQLTIGLSGSVLLDLALL